MRRAMLDFVKQHYSGHLIGAEVGVYTGLNALDIMKNMPNVVLLYLFDPFEPYPEYAKGSSPRWFNTVKGAKAIAVKNLAPYKNRLVWVFKKFEEAYCEVKHSLDFIYIDGNHAYEYVKRDIELGYLLVRKGGVVGGHDYHPTWKSVMQAVNEYCKAHGIKFQVSRSDWWFIN